jgi:L-alanine-DL-glutamate epimerase-like enolase superfamily enzyme
MTETDYEAYLERAAELNRRIAAGESIMDIMRADQLARGQALIARALELDAQDGTE